LDYLEYIIKTIIKKKLGKSKETNISKDFKKIVSLLNEQNIFF